MVVLCTGALPHTTQLPARVTRLGLETCLFPNRLARLLPRDRSRVVAVVGRGYTTAVALKNLGDLAATSHPRLRVLWFVPPPVPWPDWSVPAASGEVAEFVRAVLGGGGDGGDGDGLPGSATQFVQRVVLPDSQEQAEEVLREGLLAHGVDYAIECSGFRRARLPELRPRVPRWTKLSFDPETGSFGPSGRRSDRVIGLFAAGSAFPAWGGAPATRERETAGVLESLRYVERVLPAWVEATRRGHWRRTRWEP
ncbi:hypothetical protein VTH06DRAFT_2689 [Thermothelomyces fergusii]